MGFSDPHRISHPASCYPWLSLIAPQKKPFPPLQRAFRPHRPEERGRSPCNRFIQKDVQRLGFIGLRKLSPSGCLRELSQPSPPLVRGMSREVKKTDGKLQNAMAERHMLRRWAALPDLSLIWTTCGIQGLRWDGTFASSHHKWLFPFKGLLQCCPLLLPGQTPCCQAYFYGLSPKQVQNSVGFSGILPLASERHLQAEGNSKQNRLSHSLLIFSLSSETF
jgi:hypothetical protein